MDEYGHSFVQAKPFVREGPARGYWVISARVIDQARYFTYLEVAVDAIDRLGGRMVIRSAEVIVAAGAPKPRLVVVEFASRQQRRKRLPTLPNRPLFSCTTGSPTLMLPSSRGTTTSAEK